MARAAKKIAPKPVTRRGRKSAVAKPDKGGRLAKAAARRDAILDAALDEFSASGFAAARLDDVAKRAGIAKGTIYLYFKDKESLFQELVLAKMSPIVGGIESVFATDLPLRVIADNVIALLLREVFSTQRQQVVRLIISEGPRFPAIAEFYYHEVLSRLLAAMRGLLRRALARGELADDTLIRFPQLLGAPVVVGIVWSGLFDRFEPLDVPAMMRAHFDRLFAAQGRPA
jgi:AcrR family transcriptional regulator